MARVDLPLPVKDKDYDSRKSRAKLVNLMVDVNNDGSFKAIVKREGSELAFTTPNGDGIVSNFVSGGTPSAGSISEAFVFAGTDYTYISNGTSPIAAIAAHGQSGPFTSRPTVRGAGINDSPDEFLFGTSASPTGVGLISSGVSPGTNTNNTETDFTGNSLSMPVALNGRFYLVASTAPFDEFFASDLLDGQAYDALAFASADEVVGNLRALVPVKSGMYVFCDRNIEYWQTFDDALFPLRRVKGASIDIGVRSNPATTSAQNFIDSLNNTVGFIGSDGSVYLIAGGQLQKISDIDFANLYDNINEGISQFCHFMEGANHVYFCVTSINMDKNAPLDFVDEFTWVYDLKTGQSHYRTSPSLDYWDKFYSYNPTATGILAREHNAPGPGPGFTAPIPSPDIHRISREYFDDNGTDFECILQTASLSFSQDSTIEYIELEMETGVGNGDSADPEMTVEYSKDGGVNFTTWGTKKLGGSTDKSKRVRMNSFGRVVRHTDFILRLTMSEPVRFELYGAYAEVSGGF